MTLKEKMATLTASPGVYLMKDAAGKVIYVGKAKSIKNRVASYFQPSADHPLKIQHMVEQVADRYPMS